MLKLCRHLQGKKLRHCEKFERVFPLLEVEGKRFEAFDNFLYLESLANSDNNIGEGSFWQQGFRQSPKSLPNENAPPEPLPIFAGIRIDNNWHRKYNNKLYQLYELYGQPGKIENIDNR